ncbi:radical SAM protein [Chloroflexota bacterium]
MKNIALQSGIIYGPVRSRRLGWSLGLNSSPVNYKLCSFNCVYCQYGWTPTHTMDIGYSSAGVPTPDDFAKELENTLIKCHEIQIDNITFSGNGEPTLHPEFEKLVDITKQLRDRYCPKANIAVLSNSSTVNNDMVRRALAKLDSRIMKLDAGTPETFKKINRPCHNDIDYDAIVNGLKSLKNVSLQTMFVDGAIQNTGNIEIDEWKDRVGEIQPIKVQIYSLHRPPAASGLLEVPRERLNEIATQTERATGVRIEVIVAQNPYSKRYNQPHRK